MEFEMSPVALGIALIGLGAIIAALFAAWRS
jgi:hypothetical protein